MEDPSLDPRVVDLIVEGLRRAAQAPDCVPLFKSGKTPGVFSVRSGDSGQAAREALRREFLTVERSEVKGKTSIEWVRLAPQGVSFLAENESLAMPLRRLGTLLARTEEDFPAWIIDLKRKLTQFEEEVLAAINRQRQDLQDIRRQIGEALEKIKGFAPPLPQILIQEFPWAGQALQFIEQWQAARSTSSLALPELFNELVRTRPELTLASFHKGLKRLHDQHYVQLQPPPDGVIPLPEFALLDGAALLYYVAR